MTGASRPFPGALTGSILGAALTVAVGWWWFRALRQYRDEGAEATAPDDVNAVSAEAQTDPETSA
jgi:hypothetical protein